MKKILGSGIALAMFSILFFSSCSDEATNLAPEFDGIVISDNNKTVTLTFTEKVYAMNNQTGALTADEIDVTIANVDFDYEVEHTAGSETATITLLITSVTDGTETIVISPSNGESIFDAEGLAMNAEETITSEPIASDRGIIGNWYSSGDNVAPLLVTYFDVDSIYAEFKDDFTYVVEQFNIDNTSETPDLIFTGTFTIEKSNIGEIWTIEITQENPYAATTAGIFEVKTNPEVLWYEVVQTSATQNVPPTPEEGFGSSNGGTLGETNIQKFIRISN